MPGREALAVRVGFEPTEPVKVQRFSRPPDSTALAPHRVVCTPIYLIMPATAERDSLPGARHGCEGHGGFRASDERTRYARTRGAGLRPAMPPVVAACLLETKTRRLESRRCRPEARSTHPNQ